MLFSISLVFTSCSKDDDTENEPTPPIENPDPTDPTNPSKPSTTIWKDSLKYDNTLLTNFGRKTNGYIGTYYFIKAMYSDEIYYTITVDGMHSFENVKVGMDLAQVSRYGVEIQFHLGDKSNLYYSRSSKTNLIVKEIDRPNNRIVLKWEAYMDKLDLSASKFVWGVVVLNINGKY